MDALRCRAEAQMREKRGREDEGGKSEEGEKKRLRRCGYKGRREPSLFFVLTFYPLHIIEVVE